MRIVYWHRTGIRISGGNSPCTLVLNNPITAGSGWWQEQFDETKQKGNEEEVGGRFFTEIGAKLGLLSSGTSQRIPLNFLPPFLKTGRFFLIIYI